MNEAALAAGMAETPSYRYAGVAVLGYEEQLAEIDAQVELSDSKGK